MKKYILFLTAAISFFFLASCTHEVIGPLDPVPGQPNDSIPTLPPLVSDCDPDSIYYENTIAPLLSSSCGSSNVNCHNGPSDQNDEIDLSSWWAIMNSNEGDLVIAGNPFGSEMIDEILDGNMPPDTSSYSISNEQIDFLIDWIAQGAAENGCNEGCDTSNVSFQDDIFPIVTLYCTSCHSGSSPDGGFYLTDYSSISNAVLNGNVIDAISWEGNVTPMPYNGNQIPQCYIDLIQIWANNGAPEN